MNPRHATIRIAALSLGLAIVLAGTILFGASFTLATAYLRNSPLAVAWAHTSRPPGQPLIYPGYEADLEESSIRLMYLGTWTAFGGVALVILSRSKSRKATPLVDVKS